MFGHNEVVGQKFFREAPEALADKLLVTSVFHTIQGEGPYAGLPAVFVRLAKCQYACSFCDTYFDSGDWMDFGALLGRASAAGLDSGHAQADLMVVTGGEPTLQQPTLGKFLAVFLRDPRHPSPFTRAQIESNGLIPADVPDGTMVVVSPKCAEVGGRPRPYARLPAASLARADCLKFVLRADPASPYSAVPDWALEWRASTGREVYVSPMAEYRRTPEQARALYEARSAP
ncbi:MAG: 7-carboxy-7-deazaguanine synthase QueE, partial [Dehalococcoidia bacterium]|nr:7-carboxy-7-deazaguanine synthase QueE [Dehalococcoidia bacterium]